MSIGEICNREVVVTGPDASIAAAARLMREHHVGDLVVIDEDGEEPAAEAGGRARAGGGQAEALAGPVGLGLLVG